MVNRSPRGLSREDRRRNEKLRRLREAVPEGAAILGIDLAQAKQVAVVTRPGTGPSPAGPSPAPPGAWTR